MGDQFDLFDLEFDEVSFVPGGDNPEAHIVLSKSYVDPWVYETTTFDVESGEFVVEKREISVDQRKKLRDMGQAMPDLSYPVEHTGDLNNAIQAWGRCPADKRASLKRFLTRVANKLKAPKETLDRISALSLTSKAAVSLDSWINGHSQTDRKVKKSKVIKIRQRGDNGQFFWTEPEQPDLSDWITQHSA